MKSPERSSLDGRLTDDHHGPLALHSNAFLWDWTYWTEDKAILTLLDPVAAWRMCLSLDFGFMRQIQKKINSIYPLFFFWFATFGGTLFGVTWCKFAFIHLADAVSQSNAPIMHVLQQLMKGSVLKVVLRHFYKTVVEELRCFFCTNLNCSHCLVAETWLLYGVARKHRSFLDSDHLTLQLIAWVTLADHVTRCLSALPELAPSNIVPRTDLYFLYKTQCHNNTSMQGQRAVKCSSVFFQSG